MGHAGVYQLSPEGDSSGWRRIYYGAESGRFELVGLHFEHGREFHMAKVFIPASLWSLTGGVRVVELPGETVRDLVLGLEAIYPEIAGRLRTGDSLRPGLAVAIDTSISPRGLRQPVSLESEVHFLPTISGG